MDEMNWVDAGEDDREVSVKERELPPTQSKGDRLPALVMVETAFLSSAASLMWLINYYFPLGPVLQLLFPIPIALIYLRRGNRAAWMGVLISGLLLSVLMGPTRSIMFTIPYAVLGVQLGAIWQRGGSWYFSMVLGTILGTFGSFFRIVLISIFLGENFWLYAINQITRWLDWIFIKLGILVQPEIGLIQAIAFVMLVFNSLLYTFTVHLVALLLFDRLKNPIPRPPAWIQAFVEYDY
ncbi:MAG: DUF2232 domain-containing protein [Cyanobacteria bacterium SBLK]|nr:DUF2232 domain-containing protein [Cyanobacteria bacterium SBLK]